MSRRRTKPEIWIPVFVALITMIGSLAGVIINNQQAESRARQELLPTIDVLQTKVSALMSTPSIGTGINLFIDRIEGKDNEFIEAPFEVLVKGTAIIPDGLYLYLVVHDNGKDYVQPEPRHNTDGTFEGECYLGEEKNPNAINKTYRIFAILTDQKYGTSAPLDWSTVKAHSNTILLYRTR